ncbi:MAG: carbon storage regulator [Alphaproteobacteria bacterium]|nr:carbon storage regulator [Alphaproteobacteria bacterium]
MLYLNRKPGDAVIINHNIEVRVVEVRGKTVKLGFDFPAEASVLRAEIVEQVKEANRRAIDAARSIGEPEASAATPALKTRETS